MVSCTSKAIHMLIRHRVETVDLHHVTKMHARLIRNIRAVVTISIFVMDEEKHHAEEEADRAHSYVCDAQERVFAAHPGDGAEDHALPAVKAADRVV